MHNSINIGSVDHVSITVLVDNKADLIVESSDQVKYFTDKPLLAEHGYSVLIQLGDLEGSILWDAVVSKVALMENMLRMKLDTASVAGWSYSIYIMPMILLYNVLEKILH